MTIINLETVVLPALWTKDEPQGDAAALSEFYPTSQTVITLFQFVRVWYTAL